MGFTEGLLPAYVGLSGGDVQVGFAMKFWRTLKRNDNDLAMQEMKAYLAGVPDAIPNSSRYSLYHVRQVICLHLIPINRINSVLPI